MASSGRGSKTLRYATSTDDRAVSAKWMASTLAACELTRWAQPPDAENRRSGGVGGLTGAIALVQPDRELAENYTIAFQVKRMEATDYALFWRMVGKPV